MPKDYQEELIEDFYQHMLKSTPVLSSFERASLKLKVKELLTTYGNARELEGVEKERERIIKIAEGMKRDPLSVPKRDYPAREMIENDNAVIDQLIKAIKK
jgi:hypothetical protein